MTHVKYVTPNIAYYRGDHFDLLEKGMFLRSIFLSMFLFFDLSHEQLSLEEVLLAEAKASELVFGKRRR